ncbi:tripartite tricarboxylate transporter substrate binding protein [Verticiella sediminum]|uniref:Tripartite tricarboxylate transporter substrate binding protein n=1 Tax=Verticiella sediminum TaxID=1247510 RepID=A0A556AJM7_9BURK|nr:tripartite tricarboxylate transporter substrate binding protein [Verticiella sediminum]TSH93086.1 tripartite tricarboxylate transporter substrate binding protein [Verticiella sediminum]
MPATHWKPTRRDVLRSALFLALGDAIVGRTVFAQDATYPNRPIRIIVATAAGGGIDAVARTVGAKLQEAWGQSVIVENRPGGNQTIGTNHVAKAEPDGYTLLCISSTHTMISGLMPKLPFDPIEDFAPVTMLAYGPNILVAHPALPVQSLGDFIALAKSEPGKLNYGTSGNGSLGHLAMESLKSMTGIELTHIPYKGAAPALNAVLSGEVSVEIVQIMTALPHVKAGRLRALGITTATRSPAAPDIPTIAEAGAPGFEGSSWFGIVAPAQTPPAVIAKLNEEFVRIMNLPDIKTRFLSEGVEPVGDTPEQFAATMRDESARWGKVIKDMGITIQQ